jgi:hypothetical protein
VTALTLDIVIHALLGLLLAALTWGVGLGALSLLRGRPRAREAVDAYPLGQLVVTGVSAAILLEPWIGVPLALLSLGLLAPLARRPAGVDSALRGVVLGLAGALGLGVVLGLIWHGPTSELDSRLYGDMLFYLNKVVSASISLAPFHDLLAEGQRIIYAEGAPSFVGAAFGFDPIHFHTATLPVFFVASMVVGFRLLVGRWTTESALAASALTVVAVAYPTFVVESPPMAMALPLAFPAYRLWADELSLRHATLLAVAIGLSLFWTKALGLVALGVVILVAAYRRFGNRAGVVFWTALGVAAAAVVVGLYLTADWYADLVKTRFFPEEATRGALDQLDRRDTRAAAPAFILVGQLLLLAFLVRARLFVFAGAYGASMAAVWFVGGYGFDVALGLGALLAALAIADRQIAPGALGWAAIATLLVSAWTRDIQGVQTALLLIALLGGSVFVALAPRSAIPQGAALAAALALFALAGAAFLGVAALAVAVLATALGGRRAAMVAVAAVAAGALAVAAIRADRLALGEQQATLTPADYEIWQEVHDRVPPDGLVFTSMTGPERNGNEGWNNYPAIAGRQVYLAGWIDGRLVANPDELAQRLAINRRVVAGDVDPAELRLSRQFDGYYAVLRRNEDAPDSFRPIYENERYRLYRITR